MRDSEINYFSPAEFAVLMALTGAENYYSIGADDEKCSVEDFRRAYGSLYQRGYLKRIADGFALTEQGDMFRKIHAAELVLEISSGDNKGTPKLCYYDKQRCWLLEMEANALSTWYRVQELGHCAFEKWLRDAELLEQPLIPAETASIMKKHYEDLLQNPSGECVFRIKCLVRGQVIKSYEIFHNGGVSLLSCTSDGVTEAEIYTEESARRMLNACFEVE